MEDDPARSSAVWAASRSSFSSATRITFAAGIDIPNLFAISLTDLPFMLDHAELIAVDTAGNAPAVMPPVPAPTSAPVPALLCLDKWAALRLQAHLYLRHQDAPRPLHGQRLTSRPLTRQRLCLLVQRGPFVLTK